MIQRNSPWLSHYWPFQVKWKLLAKQTFSRDGINSLKLKWLNLLAAWCKWHLGCCPLFTVLLYCQGNFRKVSDPFDIVWWMTPHIAQRLIEDGFNNLFLLIPLECFLQSSKIRSLLFDISRRCQIFPEGRFDIEIKISRLLGV